MMIFEIDADMFYSRGCVAKGKFFNFSTTQNIVIRPSKPLFFKLEGRKELCAVIDDADDLIFFFSPPYAEVFTLYSEDSYYREDPSWEPGDEIVPERFTGLDFEEFRSEFFWQEKDILQAWERLLDQYDDLTIDRDEAYRDGFHYPDGYCEDYILPFKEFKRQYIQSRDFQVMEDFLDNKDLTFIRATGGWASGAWYPDDFRLDGFKKLRSIKAILPDAKKIKITSLSQIKKMAMTAALKNLNDEKELAEYIESERGRRLNVSNLTPKLDSSKCVGVFFSYFLLPGLIGAGFVYGIFQWLF